MRVRSVAQGSAKCTDALKKKEAARFRSDVWCREGCLHELIHHFPVDLCPLRGRPGLIHHLRPQRPQQRSGRLYRLRLSHTIQPSQVLLPCSSSAHYLNFWQTFDLSLSLRGYGRVSPSKYLLFI